MHFACASFKFTPQLTVFVLIILIAHHSEETLLKCVMENMILFDILTGTKGDNGKAVDSNNKSKTDDGKLVSRNYI